MQLHSDEDFFTQTLGKSHPSPGQVSFNQSDSTSNSDLDTCALVNTSDHICSSPDFGSDKGAKSTGHAHGSGRVQAQSWDQKRPSQADNNKQILSQLSRLGDRLTNIETVQQQACKKSVDVKKIKNPKVLNKQTAKTTVSQEGVALSLNSGLPNVSQYHVPPPAALRQNAKIQQEVQQRLYELSEKIGTGNGKIKSPKRWLISLLITE